MSGWIKLHRKLLDWEWYSKPVVKSVFIHSLLRANHKDGKWQGKEIKRGSFISSIDKLSSELGHSRQEIRTALKHLKSTNELTANSNTQHTVFTVINYDNYQEATGELTNEQPTPNQRATTNKNVKNEKNNNKVDAIDYEAVTEVYNRCLTNLGNIAKMTATRKKLVKKFFDEFGLNITKFESYLTYINDHNDCQWMFEKRPMNDGSGRNWAPLKFEYFISEKCYLNVKETL